MFLFLSELKVALLGDCRSKNHLRTNNESMGMFNYILSIYVFFITRNNILILFYKLQKKLSLHENWYFTFTDKK